MAKFKDSGGQEWDLAIDAPTIKAIRSEIQFDLLADDACTRLAVDDLLCIDVFYLLCREQCRERDVSDVQFGRLMDGDTRRNATLAFREAYFGFFQPEKRSLLQSLMQREEEVRRKAADLAIARAMDPQVEAVILAKAQAKIDQALISTGPNTATSSPAKSESDPTA